MQPQGCYSTLRSRKGLNAQDRNIPSLPQSFSHFNTKDLAFSRKLMRECQALFPEQDQGSSNCVWPILQIHKICLVNRHAFRIQSATPNGCILGQQLRAPHVFGVLIADFEGLRHA